MRADQQRLARIGVLAAAALFALILLFKGSSQSGVNSHVSSFVDNSRDDGYKRTSVSTSAYPASQREKATFVTLARNNDLWELVGAIRQMEDRFNRKFNYDWVFLNDEPFTDEFKRTTSAIVSGETKYGIIPKEHWSFPEWIDTEKAAKAREQMKADKVIYGDSISYRHMCRFESGFFFQHPLMAEYDFYWRVEPSVKFHCDVNYDVFKFMRENKKKYGFAISIHEYVATIPTLWETTRKFMKEYPQHIHKNNMMDFISNDGGATYNMCHFWSNFEIGDLTFLRGQAYQDYFNYLDQAGGFFYERWGDAPVHSIAAALFLDRDEIHFFDDVGYFHAPFHMCPIDDEFRLAHRCACNPNDDFTWKGYSCTSHYFKVNRMKKPNGWEKYAL